MNSLSKFPRVAFLDHTAGIGFMEFWSCYYQYKHRHQEAPKYPLLHAAVQKAARRRLRQDADLTAGGGGSRALPAGYGTVGENGAAIFHEKDGGTSQALLLEFLNMQAANVLDNKKEQHGDSASAGAAAAAAGGGGA
eukprot:SAG22_NODE_1796_length_3550_cov_3.789047_5_plen_136_part_01